MLRLKIHIRLVNNELINLHSPYLQTCSEILTLTIVIATLQENNLFKVVKAQNLYLFNPVKRYPPY